MSRRLCKSCHHAQALIVETAIFLTLFIVVSPLICVRRHDKNFSPAASVWMKVVYPESQWLVKTIFFGSCILPQLWTLSWLNEFSYSRK